MKIKRQINRFSFQHMLAPQFLSISVLCKSILWENQLVQITVLAHKSHKECWRLHFPSNAPRDMYQCYIAMTKVRCFNEGKLLLCCIRYSFIRDRIVTVVLWTQNGHTKATHQSITARGDLGLSSNTHQRTNEDTRVQFAIKEISPTVNGWKNVYYQA